MAIYERVEQSGGRRKLRLRSPVTLEPIDELECADAGEVRIALERARRAQAEWAATSFKHRAKLMYRLVDLVLERRDSIMDTVIRETGKPRVEAMSMEVYASCESIVFYAKRAGKLLARETRKLHGVMGLLKKVVILYKPRGVVAVITPWNGPFVLAINPSVQAVMAGNAVIIKPSEVTPRSGALVEDFFRDAGFPKYLVQALPGDGQTGSDLVEAGPDKVSFTGSLATGRKVAQACSQRLIPFSLELGGKDAMVVCADADLERAADGALMGSCMNTGQYCCGTERIYVVPEVYDAFVEKVLERARVLRQSDGEDCDVGATFWDRQLQIVEEHVTEAVQMGARVHLGGGRNPNLKGLYFEPTVMTEVNHEMKIMRDETFGPVVCIYKVADEDEAIRLANASRYGLNGNVWTRDKAKGLALAARLDTGAASVNDMAMSYGVNEVPFGGVKESGLGVVNGPEGLRSYCHAMPVVLERFAKGPLSKYPYTTKTLEGLAKGAQFFFGNRLMRKLFG